jgi:hypothetical protein
VKRVVVHIDRVTLHGVDPNDRARALEGFAAALVEQLSRPGVAQSLATMAHRPSLKVRPAAAPSVPGRIADAGRAAGAALGREMLR